jgi:hypothetical protein
LKAGYSWKSLCSPCRPWQVREPGHNAFAEGTCKLHHIGTT